MVCALASICVKHSKETELDVILFDLGEYRAGKHNIEKEKVKHAFIAECKITVIVTRAPKRGDQ